MQLYVDNAAGESFQHSTCESSKLKGIFNLHDKVVKELKDENKVWAVHVDTTENLADMMTKGLTADVRDKLDKTLIKLVEKVALQQRVRKMEKVETTISKIRQLVELKKKNSRLVKLTPAI